MAPNSPEVTKDNPQLRWTSSEPAWFRCGVDNSANLVDCGKGLTGTNVSLAFLHKMCSCKSVCATLKERLCSLKHTEYKDIYIVVKWALEWSYSQIGKTE